MCLIEDFTVTYWINAPDKTRYITVIVWELKNPDLIVLVLASHGVLRPSHKFFTNIKAISSGIVEKTGISGEVNWQTFSQ